MTKVQELLGNSHLKHNQHRHSSSNDLLRSLYGVLASTQSSSMGGDKLKESSSMADNSSFSMQYLMLDRSNDKSNHSGVAHVTVNLDDIPAHHSQSQSVSLQASAVNHPTTTANQQA